MYNQITFEHSLFFINEQYVFDFQQLAEKMNPLLKIPIDDTSYYNMKDMWISAFNFWVLLHREEEDIIESFDKILYYSSNHIMFNALKNDYYINYFRSHPDTTLEHIYILSILLTKQINNWYVKILKIANQRPLIKRNQQCHYYLMHLQSKELLQPFMKDQAILVKILIQHLNSSNEFELLVKKCCDEASFFYQDFINNKSHQTL
ncbi:hypothetical protein LZ480_04425 [Solibacillus sp. MA9]|uniref:Transcriptional regulator n=1 Tax=Solibacillus palustris TaxID=2908203 RepID=A0ABS9UAD3_9BACL|nr:hypothetical protein [Solibacillus sp. MA9]MCH7321129.1 hypothetical protein [Solibacillus sp. MA9]